MHTAFLQRGNTKPDGCFPGSILAPGLGPDQLVACESKQHQYLHSLGCRQPKRVKLDEEEGTAIPGPNGQYELSKGLGVPTPPKLHRDLCGVFSPSVVHAMKRLAWQGHGNSCACN